MRSGKSWAPLLPHDTGLENQEIKLPSLEKSRTNGFAVANIFRRRACYGFCINVPSRLLSWKSGFQLVVLLWEVSGIWGSRVYLEEAVSGDGPMLVDCQVWMVVLCPSCQELKPGAKTAPLSCFSRIQSALAEAASLGHDSPCFFLSIGCNLPCLFFVNYFWHKISLCNFWLPWDSTM